jgi:hypothetical protein
MVLGGRGGVEYNSPNLAKGFRTDLPPEAIRFQPITGSYFLLALVLVVTVIVVSLVYLFRS